MIGPGKYDALLTQARELASAHNAILIILDGDKGPGFSCQTTVPVLTLQLPDILRAVADQIEADARKGIL